MANYHLVDYKIRTGDFDSRKKLQPSAILDYFQDVAGEHAIELGVGRDDILAQNLVWVVVRIRYKVVKDIPIYANVKVRTWPLESNRAIFRREYLIENEKMSGEIFKQYMLGEEPKAEEAPEVAVPENTTEIITEE